MLGELDEDAAGGRRMQKRDAFVFGAHAGHLIDQTNTCTTATIECSVQIIDGEADVVNAGSAFRDELADRGVRLPRFEEFDKRVACAEAGDPRTIGIVERYGGKSENVAVKRKDGIERIDSDANVRDSGATSRGVVHNAS
jgi:hypothetical protein